MFYCPRRAGSARVAAFVCALAHSLAALAQPAAALPTTDLPPTVITPARQAQPIDDALPATSVITRADIDRWQAVDLVSTLSRETGVQFAQTGGRGSAASIFVRGAGSSQVLVLVDGVRLNAGTSGAAALGGVSLDAIERIEIVRGNLSSLYGSAAVGGVVQIFTRQGAEDGISISVEGGDGRTLAGRASAGGAMQAVRYGGAVGGSTTQAISAIDAARVVPGPFSAGANADLDGNDSLTASLGATYRDGQTLLAASGWLSRNRTDFDSTADGPTATHLEKSQLAALNLLARTAINEQWAAQLAVGASRDRSNNLVSVPFSFSSGEFSSDNFSATWTNDIMLAGSLRAQLGAEYLRQTGESTSYDPSFSGQSQRESRNVGSGWAGLSGEHGAHQVQLNVRQDEYSDAGGATTGLVAYGYRIDPAWRLSAQWSNAFRAPSFNDLYFPFFGNPELKPERSNSVELGLQFVTATGSLRAAAFRTDTQDLIAFDPASSRAQNIDDARVTGFELGGDWRTGPWRFAANGTLLRATNESTGERLLRRAPWVANLSALFDPGRWNAGAEIAVVGPRDDLDINSFARIELASYTLVRLVAAWRATAAVTLRARIENLFDEAYETVSGYNTIGRTVIVGADLRF